MRKMTKLRQKLQISHLDIIHALPYLSNRATLFGSSRNAPPQGSLYKSNWVRHNGCIILPLPSVGSVFLFFSWERNLILRRGAKGS